MKNFCSSADMANKTRRQTERRPVNRCLTKGAGRSYQDKVCVLLIIRRQTTQRKQTKAQPTGTPYWKMWMASNPLKGLKSHSHQKCETQSPESQQRLTIKHWQNWRKPKLPNITNQDLKFLYHLGKIKVFLMSLKIYFLTHKSTAKHSPRSGGKS